MSRVDTISVPDGAAWVGRTEEREGQLVPAIAGMLGAALSHPRATLQETRSGAVLPPLWHWAAFPEFVPMEELGADGHRQLGGFLPALPYPRRMWASGRLEFHGALKIGETLHRRSAILAVDEKQGATGPMVFVRVGHVTEGGDGRVEEEQDIVYLDIPDRFRPPMTVPAPAQMDFDEPVEMPETRLFRFSAATFNAHRIHYDLPYAREVEKYPGLVVHGPMQAAMLIESAIRHTCVAPARFSFRGVHPLFHGAPVRLAGRIHANAVELCTIAEAGHQTQQARMEWE
jgi:3-methylfumaryl-CoA hydratase